MLSTQYRLRLEAICEKIVLHEEVSLGDMIWAEKLAKANRSAATILRQARRRAENPDMDEMDNFYEFHGHWWFRARTLWSSWF